jgi:hypothetical protein
MIPRWTPTSAFPLRLAAALLLLGGSAAARERGSAREKAQQQIEGELVSDSGPAANAGDIPALARLLERTGWSPTPELSGAFKVGYVFQRSGQGDRLQIDDCFTVAASRSTYTAAEVVTQLQAGVSVDVGAGRVQAGGSLVKKVKFGTPEHVALPLLKMVPTPACREVLVAAGRGGADLSAMYVVQEVLTAEIAEQTCGRVDAGGRFVMLGSAEASLSMACSQASLEPVAIAYRTTPVLDLPGVREGLSGTVSAPEEPAPVNLDDFLIRKHPNPLVTEPDPGDGAVAGDRDQDGIEDALDPCPADAETINDLNDEDGCPDSLLKSLMIP